MIDLNPHSPNSPILLTASLHVDEARKAISGLVSELIQESRKLNNASDIESITLDKAIDRILADPLGGAHRQPEVMMQTLRRALKDELASLQVKSTDHLLEARLDRLMSYGKYKETPVR
jgi:acetyl-CoA carboxylase alpha subunit